MLPEGSTLQPRPAPETAISGGEFNRGTQAQGLHRNLSIKQLLTVTALMFWANSAPCNYILMLQSVLPFLIKCPK